MQVHLWCLHSIKIIKDNGEKMQAKAQRSINSPQSLSALNWDYKCDTFGLERLHKSWPKVNDGGDTPASGKVRIKGANLKMSETRALALLTFFKIARMISPGVPAYVRSTLPWFVNGNTDAFASLLSLRRGEVSVLQRLRGSRETPHPGCPAQQIQRVHSAPMGRWNNR